MGKQKSNMERMEALTDKVIDNLDADQRWAFYNRFAGIMVANAELLHKRTIDYCEELYNKIKKGELY